MDVVSIKGVSKSFGKKEVLQDLNLSIGKGERVGIFGYNGSGKSVLIKIIAGFLKQDKGRIEHSGTIGFSAQNNSIYGGLTVRENLLYFSDLYNVKQKKSRIEELIEDAYLQPYSNTLVMELSGGTQKRVDIACALLNDPEIIVLDEPFTGLDPILVKELINFLYELNKKGKTIIVSSHILHIFEDFCNKLIFIYTKINIILLEIISL